MAAERDEHIARRMLEKYRDQTRELSLNMERLSSLEQTMTEPKAQRLDGMPRGGDPFCDRISSLVAKKDKLEELITRQAVELERMGDELEGLISIIEKADERAVLRLRYLDGKAWPDVFLILFGSKGDYEEKYDAYARRTYRVHGSALLSLAKIYDEMRGGSKA